MFKSEVLAEENPRGVEPYVTLKRAAEVVGVPYHALVRAVRAGVVPHYRLSDRRKYVRVRDIETVMARLGQGVSDGQ